MLKEYIINQLPDYILENDSYVSGGKGFIERYLEIFGEELDNNSLTSLEAFDTKIGPIDSDAQYLTYLEGALGNLKNFGLTEAKRRQFISHLVSIWTIKGTKESIERILATRDINVTSIVEETPVEGKYDNTPTVMKYDATPVIKYDSVCPTCSEITINASKGYVDAVTAAELVILNQLLELVLPINTSVLALNIS